MKRLMVFMFALFLLIGCTDPVPTSSRYISFENSYESECNIPVVKSTIQGKTVYFIVDTGANMSLIDTYWYRKHQELFIFSKTVEVQYHGISGSTGIHEVDVVIGELPIGDVLFMESDLSAVRNQLNKYGYEVVGIIGSDFFERTSSVIDYSNRALYFANLNIDSLALK